MRSKALLVAAGMAALAACDGARTPTDTLAPAASISDGAHGGTPGFHWLPPMVASPAATGTFDGGLSPVVEICALGPASCAPVATYTTTSGPGGERVTVRASESHYLVNWHTRDFGLDSATVYRIRVTAGPRTLGHADVRIVANGGAARQVNTAEYIPLVDGRTLPVRFRIDTGIPGAITVTPPTATVEPGGTQRYTAVVTDLHGSVMANASIAWSSGTTSVATISQAGLATGAAEGEATITATSGGLSASAKLIVDEGIHRWFRMDTAADQGNWAVWGSAADNVYAANWTGVVHYDGVEWSRVDTVWWHGTLDIDGTSASNIYAVGPGGRILHYDGKVWRNERFDGATVTAHPLYDWHVVIPDLYLWGVWAAGPDDWFVVGQQGTILRGRAGNWQKMSSGTGTTLRRVWGTSPTNVYATGDGGVLLHFDGTSWSPVTLPASVDLWGVWGSGPADVYAVGAQGKVFHYDGAAWTLIQLPTPNFLYGVWGTSGTHVFVGGQGGVVYRWNGVRWIYEDGGTPAQIYDFWGPDGTDVFGATAGWDLIHR